MNRPALTRRGLLGGAAAATLAGLLPAALLRSASAAADDYRALVCLFLYGGNDGLNMVTVRDATRHAQYAGVRGALALPRDQLVPLNADYGLHPAMAALAPAWADGALAAVHNVGPLYAPITKAEYLAAGPGSPLVPEALFSHSDQQLLWEAAGTSAFERTGWGGRAAATLPSTNPVISFGGNSHFGLGELTAPWVLPGPGSEFGAQGFYDWAPVQARRAALDQLYAEAQRSPLAEAASLQQRAARDLELRLQGLFSYDATATDPITQAFAPLIEGGNGLAAQLMQVMRFVANRSKVQGTRQIFFVQMGGFDNHAGQVGGSPTEGEHAGLMKGLADALGAFWSVLKSTGLAPQVTLFTQSDFGRTFATNDSNGTDHAWGNEQLVLGGAVRGKATYGRYPELVLGGPDDVGVEEWERQGRWIPTSGVDPYAATLLRWWGLSEAQLDAVLPNLKNFGSARGLGFMG